MGDSFESIVVQTLQVISCIYDCDNNSLLKSEDTKIDACGTHNNFVHIPHLLSPY